MANVGLRSGLGQAKGKEKAKGLNTVASNESLFKDLQPLKQDHTVSKTAPKTSLVKATDRSGGQLVGSNISAQSSSNKNSCHRGGLAQENTPSHIDSTRYPIGPGGGWTGPDLGRPPNCNKCDGVTEAAPNSHLRAVQELGHSKDDGEATHDEVMEVDTGGGIQASQAAISHSRTLSKMADPISISVP